MLSMKSSFAISIFSVEGKKLITYPAELQKQTI